MIVVNLGIIPVSLRHGDYLFAFSLRQIEILHYLCTHKNKR